MNLERRIDAALGESPRPRLGGKRRHAVAKGKLKWGFKGIPLGLKGFQGLFRSIGAKKVPFVEVEQTSFGTLETFFWKGKDVTVITNDNPLTGWFGGEIRNDHIGYAHYVGIEGKSAAVKRAVKFIKNKLGDDLEETPGKRGYI